MAIYVLFLSLRSLCKGFYNVWRPETEEKKNINEKKHSQSCLQWSHCFWCSTWEHRPNKSFNSSNGLWPVRNCVLVTFNLKLVTFLTSYYITVTFTSERTEEMIKHMRICLRLICSNDSFTWRDSANDWFIVHAQCCTPLQKALNWALI